MPRAGAHALLTRPPLGATPKDDAPFDLHVLGAPPAFVLSQDQTLSFIPFSRPERPNLAPPSPCLRAAVSLETPPPGYERHRRQVKKTRPQPGAPFGITWQPAGSRLRVLIGHPQARAHGPSKAMTSSSPGTRPTARTTPRRTHARTSVRKKPLVTYGCAKDQRPTPGRRPRIPSCLFTNHVKQQTPRDPAAAIRSRRSVSGTRYIDSSPPRLKALLRKFEPLTLVSKYSIQH
jgi:hypothetical protein